MDELIDITANPTQTIAVVAPTRHWRTLVVSGLGWIGGYRLFTRFLTYGKLAILARLLGPTEFGIYGIAAVALTFLEIMTETGINVVLIQEDDRWERFINTAWVVSIIRGFLLGLLLLLFVLPISWFFNAAQVIPSMLVMATVPIIRGFINPAVIRWQKELQFEQEARLRTILFIVGSIATILFAYKLHSAISLVLGLGVEALLEVGLTFWWLKPWPRFEWKPELFWQIIHRGKWVTASGLFNYIYQQGDDVVAGRMLGTAALGLYQMAYKISTLPISEVADVFGRVMFPVYSKVKHDSKKLWKAYWQTTLGVSLISIPFGIILFIWADVLTQMLLGEQWFGIVPALRVLSWFGVWRAITGSSSSLLLACQQQRAVSIITLISAIAMGILVIPLTLKFGILGTSWAALMGSVISAPVIMYFVYQTFKIQKK